MKRRIIGRGPEFWENAFFITALLIGLVFGGAVGWYQTGSFLFLVGGSVIGLILALLSAGMGVKETPKTLGGYLGDSLLVLWMGLICVLLFFKAFAVAAAACAGPMLLLTIASSIASRMARRREGPKLGRYFEQIALLFGEGAMPDGNARGRARELTLQLLPELGKEGKKRVVSMLYDKRLIIAGDNPIDLGGADLARIVLQDETLNQICLNGVDLSQARLKGAQLMGASFQNSNLSQATMDHADLSQANLNDANLSRAYLVGSKLRSAQLARASLSDGLLSVADLRAANLSGSDCRGAKFLQSDLTSADLRGADLRQANLGGADLTLADLRGADVREADFRRANLPDADLTGAQLQGAKFD